LLRLNSRRFDPAAGRLGSFDETFEFSPNSRCADSAIVDGQCPADWLRSAHFRFFIPGGLASLGAFSLLYPRWIGFVRRIPGY
jgi:hypothetical protein